MMKQLHAKAKSRLYKEFIKTYVALKNILQNEFKVTDEFCLDCVVVFLWDGLRLADWGHTFLQWRLDTLSQSLLQELFNFEGLLHIRCIQNSQTLGQVYQLKLIQQSETSLLILLVHGHDVFLLEITPLVSSAFLILFEIFIKVAEQ